MMMMVYNGPEREGWIPGMKYSIRAQYMSGWRYKSPDSMDSYPETRMNVWRDGPSQDTHLFTIEKEEFDALFTRAPL